MSCATFRPMTRHRSVSCPAWFSPCAAVQVAARVQALFPPRGGIRLLARETTHGKGRPLDYLIAQQLVLDTVHFFDGDKLACARRLAHGEASCAIPARHSQDAAWCR